MAKIKPTLVIDGQNLAEATPGGLDLENFVRAINQVGNYQIKIVIDNNFPRHKPALANDCPDIDWQRLDLSTQDDQIWSPADENHRQQALNVWLINQKLVGCPFIIAPPTHPNRRAVWPAHSSKICLWPNRLPDLDDLDLLIGADLVLTPTKSIADQLVATNLLPSEKIAVIGQGDLSLEPLSGSPPNPGPSQDFVLWPIDDDEADTNQLVAIAWRLLQKQTGHNLELVVVGDLSPSQKAEIRSRVGRRVFFGRRLTAERLTWLYQQAAAVLLIRRRPGPLTPLLAALSHRRPVVASSTDDLAEITEEGIHYCSSWSILEIARTIDQALTEPIVIDPQSCQKLRRDFGWLKTARSFDRVRFKASHQTKSPRPTTALIGPSQLPIGMPGNEIGFWPPAWAKSLAVDYFYEGRPTFQNEDNWLARDEAIAYRPLIDLPGDQLDRYQIRVYYLTNHPDCYQTLLRALIYPGIIIAPSLRFERTWNQLIDRGFVSQKRLQLEIELETQAKVDDDCRGAWSLIRRSTGVIVETASDETAAKKIKKSAPTIKLVEPGDDMAPAIANLKPTNNPQPITYIDVSSLANNWLQQPWLTGIQRYEHQLLTQARKKWPNIKFVFWSDGPQAMVVISNAIVDQLIELITDFQSGGSHRQLSRHQARLKQAFMNANHHLVANPDDRLLIPQGLWENHAYAKFVGSPNQRLRVYQVIHDLVFNVYPQYTTKLTRQSLGNYLAQVAPSCPHFITISKNTSKDLKDYCRQAGLPSPRYSICPLGDDPVTIDQATEEISDLTDQQFILSIGTIEPRKNHRLLLEAYQKAARTLPRLCIVGRVGWLVDDLLTELKNHPKITLLTDVNDRQLAWLYQNCAYTVFPSFYEGWGLPVSESLAWGCPILAANTSSLPEVGGQLADYFDPHDVDQLLELMTKYLDPKINLDRRRQIKRNYRPRSWAKSVDQLLKLITNQASPKN